MTGIVSYNAETYTLSVSHGFYYSTKEPVPVDAVIEALQGLDGIVPSLPNVIEGILNGVEIAEVRLFIDKIESGSLIEDFIIDFVFKGPEGYERFRRKLREKSPFDLGDNDGEKKAMTQLVGYALVAVVSAGAVYSVFGTGQSTPNIDVHHNTVINFGAGKFNFTPEEMAVVIQAATQEDKKVLAKNAVKVIKPAKQDDEAELIIDGLQDVKFSPEIVEEVPVKYKAPKQEERSQDYTNVRLVIFASDQDKRGQGWAGIIPGVVDNRTLLKISDDLEPSELHGHVSVQADVAVISRYSKKDNRMVPYKILVKAFSI